MEKHNYIIKAESGSRKGLMLMTGFISPWENNDVLFRSDFKNLEASYSEIDIIIQNLFGGSVVNGIPIYNLIKDSKSKTNTIVEGLAASMGAILALAGNNEKEMKKMSRLMLHRAKVAVYGDHDDLIEGSEMVKGYHDDLVNVIVENSNREKSWVEKTWMVRGKDTYLTAEKAKEYGMVTKITNSAIKDVPKDVLKSKDIKAIYNHYQHQSLSLNNLLNNNKNPLKMEKVIEKLGLPKDSSEDAVLEAIAKIENSNKPEDQSKVSELEKEIEKLKEDGIKNKAEAQKEKAEVLVNSAIQAKKIKPEQKEDYLKLATSDYDSTKKVLDGMQGFTSLSGAIQNGGGDTSDPYAGKDWNWMTRNASAVLAKWREDKDPRYDTLFNAEFKKG